MCPAWDSHIRPTSRKQELTLDQKLTAKANRMGVEERKPGQAGLSPGLATVCGTLESIVIPAPSLILFTCRMGMKMDPIPPPECSRGEGEWRRIKGSFVIPAPGKYPRCAQGLAIMMLFTVALFMISQLGSHPHVQ